MKLSTSCSHFKTLIYKDDIKLCFFYKYSCPAKKHSLTTLQNQAKIFSSGVLHFRKLNEDF